MEELLEEVLVEAQVADLGEAQVSMASPLGLLEADMEEVMVVDMEEAKGEGLLAA